MADFNTSLSAPQGAGSSVLSPVQSQELRFENPLVNLGVNLTGMFLQNKKEQEAKKKEDDKQFIISEFVRKQTALSDAEKQGVDPARIAAQARANYAQFVSNNPGLIKEFSEANKNLFEHSNLGEFKQAEQSQQDELKMLRSDFLKSGGFIPAGASKELETSLLAGFQAQRQRTAMFEQQMKINAELRAQEGADRSRIDWETKQASVKVLTEIGSSQLPISQQFILGAVEKANKGDIKGATNDLMIHFSNIEGAIAAASNTNPELAGHWKTLFDDLKKTGLSAIDGKTEADALKQQLETVITKGKLIALQDKGMLASTVASQLLGGNLPEIYWNSNIAAKNALINLGATNQETPNDPQVIGNKENEDVAYSMVEHNMRMLESGKAANPEETTKQMSNVVNKLLHQVEKTSATGIKPEQLAKTADFIASPTYAHMVEKGMIDKQAATGAHNVMQILYEKNISKAVETQLEKPIQIRNEKTGQKVEGGALSNYIDFNWNGAGVVLAKKHEATKMSIQESRDINIYMNTLKPAEKYINQLIRVGAHMEGHTNYAKYWEENKHRILPAYMPDQEMLKPGQVVDGYKYIGGNTRNPSNWEKVQVNSEK